MGNLAAASDRPAPARSARSDSGALVYLDHAATTPMLPEALQAMTEELAQTGNPSSLHNAGRRARRVVEESREQIAQAFGARPSEVVFTSGGTEADNLAVKGLYWARQADGSAGHSSELGTVLRAAIERDPATVALVSVMWANNEVGVVQPIADLAEVAREHGVPFHSDAVQAAGQLPVNLAASGATALTITAHKMGGPVGVGALLLVRGEDPVPVLHGGGQERDVRSGPLDRKS